MSPSDASPNLHALKREIIEILRATGGYLRLDEPIRLAGGASSYDYIDAKRGLALGSHLRLASKTMLQIARDEGWDFGAVGGLTMGADQFSHVIAEIANTQWFVVRKAEKDHGTGRLVEGADLSSGVAVLLVDDVVTGGGSILQAFDAIEAEGGQVVGVTALVDRGDAATVKFRELGVPYRPVLTYQDLEIEPVRDGRVDAPAAS